MTGQRLYDHYTAAAAAYPGWRPHTVLAHQDDQPIAWAFLSARDRRVWTDLARRVTPKRPKR